MTCDLLWKRVAVSVTEVCLARVLRCGQTFRWKNIDNVWTFTTKNQIVLVKQEETSLSYSWILKSTSGDRQNLAEELEVELFVHDYFNLDIQLESLYDSWKQANTPFMSKTRTCPFTLFPGIRILRQDPWETVVSFICSSNNNVKRISKMCDTLCTEFGEYINDYEGIKYYSFPSPTVLAASPTVELKLRLLGFGYRAKFIYQTARLFEDKTIPTVSMEQLWDMRQQDYETAHEFLLQLTGVGPKVADCICLMALDKHDVVPIDTHVYQIAVRDFKYKGKRDMKSLNKQMYAAMRDFYKEIFGDYAGWAQSVLFASDLNDLNNGVNVKTEISIEIKTEPEPEPVKLLVKRRKRV